MVALLGRNGAGKPTMLSIIAGLLDPDAGTVLVDSIDVWADRSAAASRIGIAPQDTGIYRVLTVRENLEFFGEIAGMGARGAPLPRGGCRRRTRHGRASRSPVHHAVRR